MTISESQIAEFHQTLTSYGYLDLEAAIDKFAQVGMTSGELADEVREYAESTGIRIDEIDVCSVAYDYILQMARNKLDSVLDFDVCNDASFYTYANAMCTSYDSSPDDIDLLKENLKEATKEQIEELLDDDFVKVFLEDVEITI